MARIDLIIGLIYRPKIALKGHENPISKLKFDNFLIQTLYGLIT